MSDTMKFILGLAAILAIFGLAGEQDYQDAVTEEQQYCEMVKLYKQTRGREGWPEYRKGEVFCGQK